MSAFDTSDKSELPRSRIVTEKIGVRLSVDADGRMRQQTSGVNLRSVRVVGIDFSVRAPAASVEPRTSTPMYTQSSVATAGATDENPHESLEKEAFDFHSLCSLLIESCSKYPMGKGLGGHCRKISLITNLEALVLKESHKSTPDLEAIINAVDDLELDNPSHINFKLRQEIFGPCQEAIAGLRRAYFEKLISYAFVPGLF